ncbi:DUF2059 domain-containing protein [Sphingosinicella sp. BN140058]|uniref:DUF2059 domain-containing protein n=1 Tax=Sphingosinicella sp. BN140058 TaxID=1892855 RepID=UPI001FB0CE9C|nr:DUF2059 domain-containing protein [Sphingosinicella sp. BN140058]
MITTLLAAAALVGAPTTAADQRPPAASTAVPQEIDPARLALARRTAAAMLPQGSFERMMDGSMNQMADMVMGQMFESRMADFMPEGSQPDRDIEREVGDKTMRQVLSELDPHFEERMRITNRVMFQEMKPVMSRIEPDLREGLSRTYARKFSSVQLQDINRFLDTQAGTAFAAESMMAWVDPEIVSTMGKFMPELIKEMPAIMEKVKAATAHLPPPPARPKTADDEAEEG